MPNHLKRNAVLVAGLAAVSWWAFMFAKHDPAVRGIVPFADDPYDAVGSFAVIGGALLAALSLIRAFRPTPVPSAAAAVYLLRSEGATVLTVYVMVVSDAIAMARHPSAWMEASAGYGLVALLAGLTVLATGTLLALQRSDRHLPAATRRLWLKAVAVAAVCFAALSFFPEHLISRPLPHLLAILFSDVLLFAPISFLLPALFPFNPAAASVNPSGRRVPTWLRWALVLLVGLGLGLFVLAAEFSEGGPPAGRLLLVVTVYPGLTIAGLAVAYAFLGSQLGLASQP